MERPVGLFCRNFRVAPWLVVGVAAVGGLAAAGVARGQLVPPGAVVDEDTPTPSTFALLKADSKTVEQIDDFKRYSEKKSWELAFHALNSIDESKSSASVPAGDGFLVPLRVRIQQLLLRLPPEGRDAYRLFNDAAAKQLWQRVSDTRGGLPSDELDSLQKLVGRYFLTSVGDLAADRLGDLLFEQGDFSNAEGAWRTVVEKYPDPHLPLAKLQCKRCVALSMLGRHELLASVVAQVRDKYSDQTVNIGGRDVNAADFCDSLLSKSAAPASVAVPRSMIEPDELSLPTADEPLWQISVAGPDLSGQTDPQTGWPLSKSSLGGPPYGAVAQNRFYANVFGVVYAADLETGKMLWRTDKFNNLSQQVMRALQSGTSSSDAFYVIPFHGKLLVGSVGSKNMRGQLKNIRDDNQWHMDCLDATTGKTVWSFRRGGMTLISPPYVTEDRIYAVGIAQNNSMQLLCIRQADAVTDWFISLGTPQNSRNWRGSVSFGGPSLQEIGNEMYVATNSGALFSVNLANHQIDWVLQHQTKPGNQNENMWWGQPLPPVIPTSAMLNTDGLFYLKDGSSQTLYVIDLVAPAIKWKRLVSADDALVAIDGQIAYLLGHELSALDLNSRKLLWSTKLPGDTIPSRPLFCPKHIFVPTERGIFDVDPATGDVQRMFRGADRDLGACRLLLVGSKLIAVGDSAVTAYPIQRTAPGKISLRSTN
jgi:outer membrane protein assembly factor BamB